MFDTVLNDRSCNLELIERLYDPAYVRPVTVMNGDAPVQVCVDARMLGAAAGTGVATYATVLARCLSDTGATAALLDDRAKARPSLDRWLSAMQRAPRRAHPRDAGGDVLEAIGQGWTARDIFKEAQVFFTLHGRLLPIRCDRPPTVMHWTYPVPLYLEGARNIYTLHDLIPLTDPGLTTIPSARHGLLVRRIAKQAAAIVTVSKTMSAVIGRRLPPNAPPIINTYQAVDASLQRDPPLPAGLRSGRYFLFCGTVEPRKNLARLVEAHARSGAEEPLVIVGPAAPGHEVLEAQIAKAATVIRLPWQPRADLLGLLRRARSLLFPSLAEGFGLPIAEAMTLGCPVLTSDREATAEIAGGAALLVDPLDTYAMAAAIATLAHDDGLCMRLRTLGFARARLFAPPAYARRLRTLYADVLAQAR